MDDNQRAGIPSDFLEEYRQKHHERYSERGENESIAGSGRVVDDDVYQLVADEEYGNTCFRQTIAFFKALFEFIKGVFFKICSWTLVQYAKLTNVEATAFSVFLTVLSVSFIMLIMAIV
ncbi:hypothetical protein BdWA1_002429 [Babesia duncani]|uniref:Uncharacterized protein n=1 Tax=Babesia duncani TaxID=323732 RepID=A0AAD9UM05_9APIC|nr:hypothetical protein BdWA1_004043 [Babesia duncani]KAK2194754.1 hypothetical protein BdWA1_003766 [Babesia duncani]KAK2195833.1 hypothetical protein BdWA1_002429 [Babesia duncani]